MQWGKQYKYVDFKLWHIVKPNAEMKRSLPPGVAIVVVTFVRLMPWAIAKILSTNFFQLLSTAFAVSFAVVLLLLLQLPLLFVPPVALANGVNKLVQGAAVTVAAWLARKLKSQQQLHRWTHGQTDETETIWKKKHTYKENWSLP